MDVDVILERIAHQRGGLLEIYIFGADLEDWVRAATHLRALDLIAGFRRAGASVDLAVRSEMFTKGENVEYSLEVGVGRQTWTTGFYSEDVIDFQGDPHEVSSRDDLNDTLHLMNALHDSTGKRVILVPESLQPELLEPYVVVE